MLLRVQSLLCINGQAPGGEETGGRVREGPWTSETELWKSQAITAPPVGVGQSDQRCVTISVAPTFFPASSKHRQIEDLLQQTRITECARSGGLKACHFGNVSSCFYPVDFNPQDGTGAIPHWLGPHAAVAACGWFPLGRRQTLFRQPCIPGTFLGNWLLRSPDLRWKKNQIQKWEGTWRKGVGAPVELGLGL